MEPASSKPSIPFPFQPHRHIPTLWESSFIFQEIIFTTEYPVFGFLFRGFKAVIDWCLCEYLFYKGNVSGVF